MKPIYKDQNYFFYKDKFELFS